ncbi:hypothetical protein Nepgr_030495 [Nepenthes gracilis]|uniref:Uncharacterized protein n=1 Tax=Nepenthes gracilis TaxID=150966 RepID=A0AAD3TH35_NEPGR|nr:hypothetical protein Nepgr_030495 [Nepenthes gracilis]
MMNSTENRGKLQYLGESYYKDSITLKVKGLNIKFVRILTLITTIDVSNNKLKGEILEVIGDLVSLQWLNLAHNNFIGRIPPSLASLRELESLDLSSNKLVGQIPDELASLTSLEFFNVSQNRLVRPIPQGQQFNTFENNSYLGNLGLCGNPLSKKCGDDEAPLQPAPRMVQDGSDSEIKGTFSWAIVGIGYGFGTIFGCKWFVDHSDRQYSWLLLMEMLIWSFAAAASIIFLMHGQLNGAEVGFSFLKLLCGFGASAVCWLPLVGGIC